MTTKLFTLLLAVAASVETILAWDYERVQIGDLYYDLDATTKTAEVAGYSSATGDFVIPSSVTYNSVPYSVTSIEDYVFFNCSGLTSVTIGNSVTSIGNSAFDSCCSLISVTIGNSVTSIGDYAFRLCTGLTSITIPDSVTSIGRFAFSDCTGLTSISVAMGNTVYDSRNNCNAIIETATNTLMYGCQKTIIPYSVTSIGDYAFSDCTGLTSVIIPNSVTSIGNSAFSGCSGLTSVTIPNSVTSIGDWAFNGCTGLTSPVYNAHVFAYMPTSYSGAYTIPDGIESIAGTAFYGCSGLTSVTIGNSVTSIGERAFSYCRSLTSITIGNSVSSIGDYAFYYCTGLTSVTIPNSVTSIGSNAFYGCTSLTSVTCEATTPPSLLSNSLNKSIPLYVPAESIETYQTTNYWKTFTNILPIASPTIYCHLTVTSADETMGIVNQVSGSYEYGTEINLIATPQSNYKFSHWSDGNTETPRTIILTKDTVLTAIFDINQDLTSIKIGDLYYNLDATTKTAEVAGYSSATGDFVIPSSVTYNSVPYSVTSIGDGAFKYCTGLTSVTIGNSVTSIGERAFYGCSGLTSITIPNSVTSIGDWAFTNCTSLTQVNITDLAAWCNIIFDNADSNPLSIAKYLFLNGSVIIDLIIPNNVTSIGNYAFYHCYFRSVTFGENVTSIGGYAFYGCSGLTSITIPNSVTSIGNYAFRGCSGLTSVTIPNSVTSIGSGAFELCSSLTSVTIPNSVTSIGDEAFRECSGLTSVTIEAETPPTLGIKVFKDCPAAIYVPCGTLETYKTAWPDYGSLIKYAPLSYKISALAENGNIQVSSKENYTICDERPYYYTLTVVTNYGYHFTQWSDGNTNNPRTIVLTQDTTFTAECAYDRIGQCGKDFALTWSYDHSTKVLTIGNAGEFTENMRFGVEAPNEIEELVIGNNVTAIGENAFAGIGTLKKVSIGESVKTIYGSAFYNCVNLETIFNYRPTPSNAYSTAFDGVDKFECKLYVLPSSIDMYKNASVWRDFYYTYAIGASETTTDQNVTIIPNENSAIVTWPTSNNAATYTLQITKDGVVFCTLIFNGAGQLIGISFAPSRDGSSHAPAATMSVAGMSFTVTGLDGASKYAYNLSVADENNEELVYYQGEFATTGYEGEVVHGGEPVIPGGGTTAIDNVHPSTQSVGTTKFLRNGQLFIQRGGKTYSVTGQEER